MQHYRLYKLDDSTGRIVKGRDLHAADDARAMDEACGDPDCPICELWRGARKVGLIDEEVKAPGSAAGGRPRGAAG